MDFFVHNCYTEFDTLISDSSKRTVSMSATDVWISKYTSIRQHLKSAPIVFSLDVHTLMGGSLFTQSHADDVMSAAHASARPAPAGH